MLALRRILNRLGSRLNLNTAQSGPHIVARGEILQNAQDEHVYRQYTATPVNRCRYEITRQDYRQAADGSVLPLGDPAKHGAATLGQAMKTIYGLTLQDAISGQFNPAPHVLPQLPTPNLAAIAVAAGVYLAQPHDENHTLPAIRTGLVAKPA